MGKKRWTVKVERQPGPELLYNRDGSRYFVQCSMRRAQSDNIYDADNGSELHGNIAESDPQHRACLQKELILLGDGEERFRGASPEGLQDQLTQHPGLLTSTEALQLGIDIERAYRRRRYEPRQKEKEMKCEKLTHSWPAENPQFTVQVMRTAEGYVAVLQPTSGHSLNAKPYDSPSTALIMLSSAVGGMATELAEKADFLSGEGLSGVELSVWGEE